MRIGCKRLSRSAGLTLVEVMVVILILGIIAGIVAKVTAGRVDEAKQKGAKQQIHEFIGALDLFYNDNGFYPSTQQGLQALVEKPATGTIPEKWHPEGYMKEIPKDPWNNDYIYISPGRSGRAYDIISRGRDGQEGGEGWDADVKSWDLRG